MSLINLVAKTIFVRRSQYDMIDREEMSMYAPGPDWEIEHKIWNDLSDAEKQQWLDKAEIWLSNLQNKSEMTYSFLSTYFKEGDVNSDSMDIL